MTGTVLIKIVNDAPKDYKLGVRNVMWHKKVLKAGDSAEVRGGDADSILATSRYARMITPLSLEERVQKLEKEVFGEVKPQEDNSNDSEKEDEQTEEEKELEALRAEYKELLGKNVATSKKNDADWIAGKIEEAKAEDDESEDETEEEKEDEGDSEEE